MAPAFRPPAAAEMTCARRSVTLPATQTPGTAVAPSASAGTAYPKTIAVHLERLRREPERAEQVGVGDELRRGDQRLRRTTSPDSSRTPTSAVVLDDDLGDRALDHRDAAGGELLGVLRRQDEPVVEEERDVVAPLAPELRAVHGERRCSR